MSVRFEPRMQGVQIKLIARTHHVDADEPDASGMVDWRYEYDLITLQTSGGLEVTVRTYTDQPRQAGLMQFRLHGEGVGLGDVKNSHSDAVAAIASFLRQEGFESVVWLGGQSYVEVPY
jgi:hypothetical protein